LTIFDRIVGVGLALAFFSGCAHVQSRGASQANSEPKTLAEVLQHEVPSSNLSAHPAQDVQNSAEIVIRGVKLENTHFDIPITVNSRVEYWVDYFQGPGRKYFEKYLERSSYFVPYIVPLLKQNGLPEDLVYLAMIESGFNNHARSRARAVGPWQFMSATGKRYGLMVNWWVDERRDTRKSTLAAVEYLRDLYGMFQSWELAAAAYNAGEAKVARAVRRFGTRDFWVIARHRFLRPETRDYIPKIIAAAIIAKNRTQFGFPAEMAKPGEGEAIAGDGELVKLEKENEASQPAPIPQGQTVEAILADADEDGIDEKEDSLTPATLIVPADPKSLQKPQEANSGVEGMPLAKPVPTPHVSKKGEVGGDELVEFEVQSPADLLKVARAAGLSYQTVKSLNPELLRWCTPPGAGTYHLKLPASVKDKFLVTYNHVSFPRQVQFFAYKVKSGETLARIARRYGIKVEPIQDLNRVSPRTPLRSGSTILLPIPNDRSRTLASLEVFDPPEKRRRRRHHRKRGASHYNANNGSRKAEGQIFVSDNAFPNG
jgi:LysM repeat protein